MPSYRARITGVDWGRLPEDTPFVTLTNHTIYTAPSGAEYWLMAMPPWADADTWRSSYLGISREMVARPMQQLTLFDLHPPAPVTRRTRNVPTVRNNTPEVRVRPTSEENRSFAQLIDQLIDDTAQQERRRDFYARLTHDGRGRAEGAD